MGMAMSQNTGAVSRLRYLKNEILSDNKQLKSRKFWDKGVKD
jgi:hypothetical protein